MRKIFPVILTVLCLGLLLNCSSAAVKNPYIQREWMLVSFKNYTKDDLIKNNAKIDLTSPIENGKIKDSAFMGCNKIFFISEFRHSGKVKISGIGSTLMACRNMRLEDDFSKSFKNITHYKIEGHFLILTDEQGNLMRFVAADWD